MRLKYEPVRPYVLLATSYDASMATTAKFTCIRVVCNNTITMAVGAGEFNAGKTERDTEERAVNTLVRIPHSSHFDPDEARTRLGIVSSAWERWLVNTRLMAERDLNPVEADQFLKTLLLPEQPKPNDNRAPRPIQETKPSLSIMSRATRPALASIRHGSARAMRSSRGPIACWRVRRVS